jgi:hypothetical protein
LEGNGNCDFEIFRAESPLFPVHLLGSQRINILIRIGEEIGP